MKGRLVAATAVVVSTIAVAAAYEVREDGSPQPENEVRGTGWRGGISIGLSLRAAGQRPASSYSAPPDPGPLTLSAQAALGSAACAAAPADAPCPSAGAARISFRVSALLDARTPLPLSASEMVLSGAAASAQLTTELHPGRLAPGTHCVVVGVMEDALPVVAGQLPYHSNVAVFELRVAGSNVDHCSAAPTATDPLTGVGSVACGRPAISVARNRIELRRETTQRVLVAVAPVCGSRTLVVWAHQGAMTGAAQQPPPSQLLGPSQWTQSDVTLSSGAWLLVVLHRISGSYSTGVSQPVVIE